MSFNCTEFWSVRTLTWGQSATRAALVVNVTTSTAAIAEAIATLQSGVGASHPQDGRLWVANQNAITAAPEGGPTTWRVTFNYTRKDGATGGAAGSDELLRKPTRWRWANGLTAHEIDNDVYGNPIANSAGIPFRPKATREYPTLTLEAYKYVSRFELPLSLQFMGKLNTNTFTIAQFGTVQPGQVRCLFIGPTQDFVEVKDGEQPPVEVRHVFEIRNMAVSGVAGDPGFKLRAMDKSRKGWFADTEGKLLSGEFTVKAPKAPGASESLYVPVSDEILLDGMGQPLDENIGIGEGPQSKVKTPAISPDYCRPSTVTVDRPKGEGGPAYLNFDIYYSVDFSPLIALL